MKVGPQSHPAGFDGGPSTFSHPQICETDETVIDSEAYFWDLYVKKSFQENFHGGGYLLSPSQTQNKTSTLTTLP